ncbi:MAG: hypothetical protein K8T89_18690 [Planctomycetes bacterium]|nr:hypothetical protein [Planctomycetota bacterium]
MRQAFIIAWLLATSAGVLAQSNPQEPKALPPAVNNAPAVSGAALIRFDATHLEIKRVDNRHQLWAGKQFLKDFGPFEREASEALRLVRELGFTQYGTIAGSTPVFEYWLADDAALKGRLAAKNVILFNSKALKVEQITGAWIIRDDRQLLYNFGNQREAALQAHATILKLGFNQLGFVGTPVPVMTYLTTDAYSHPMDISSSQPDSRELIAKVAEQGLVLPEVGYVGSRTPIELRKLDLNRQQSEWVLVHGKDVIARFGPNGAQAREALRMLQDARVTELCLVGKSSFPIFLSNGLAPRGPTLGFNNQRLQPAQMRLQMINKVACITDGARILFEFGDNQSEAELILKVLKHFQFDQFNALGDVTRGGIRFFTKSK